MNNTPVDFGQLQWSRVDAAGNVYFQTSCRFGQGHFHLRVFKNGTCRLMVDVDAPGLDAKGLVDLGTRICSVLYALTGKHFSFDDIQVDDLREFNVDSSDPELTHLLHLSGVKSGLSYSRLLESYLRVYEKTEGTTRVESGGKNAFELMRVLRTPVSVLETQARMPDEIIGALNARADQIMEQVNIQSQGMANIMQRLMRSDELFSKMTAAFTFLEESLTRLTNQLEEDRKMRREELRNRETEMSGLHDIVEVLLTEKAVEKRLKEQSVPSGSSCRVRGEAS